MLNGIPGSSFSSCSSTARSQLLGMLMSLSSRDKARTLQVVVEIKGVNSPKILAQKKHSVRVGVAPVHEQLPRHDLSHQIGLCPVSLYIRFVDEEIGGGVPSRVNHHPKDQGDSTQNLRSSKV